MEYRKLGQTGLEASVVGLGCAMLGTVDTDYAVRVVRRAVDLGVTYFDTARSYWDAEVKLGLALADIRPRVVISTKTGVPDEEGAWREVNESLERLKTDYLDNYHLHCLGDVEDVERRVGRGGALEALIRAKSEGLIHHIGCTSHKADVLVAALQRFNFEIVLVPFNIVERDPLSVLAPLCERRGVALTAMKPVATGLLPARLALRWLRNQPVASAVPGATTMEELEENCLAGYGDASLTPDEIVQAEELRAGLDNVRCRLCDKCLPCPTGVSIPSTLGTDVMYDHVRTMGWDGFAAFPWGRVAFEQDLPHRKRAISAIEACTRCGDCEQRCPHGLPIVDTLNGMLPSFRSMVTLYEASLAR
jgi:hypothetical protein